MKIIEFLKDYDSLIMCFLTFILVIATIGYARTTNSMAKSSAKLIEQEKSFKNIEYKKIEQAKLNYMTLLSSRLAMVCRFAYLCGLGVSKTYRNQGICTEISRQLVDACKKNNLHIQFFCEKHLVPYYEKQGFVEFAVGMKENKRVKLLREDM